jgi:hypothetical protein
VEKEAGGRLSKREGERAPYYTHAHTHTHTRSSSTGAPGLNLLRLCRNNIRKIPENIIDQFESERVCVNFSRIYQLLCAPVLSFFRGAFVAVLWRIDAFGPLSLRMDATPYITSL